MKMGLQEAENALLSTMMTGWVGTVGSLKWSSFALLYLMILLKINTNVKLNLNIAYSIQAAITNCHRLGCLLITEIYSQCSGGWEIKAMAESMSFSSLLAAFSHGGRVQGISPVSLL